MAMSLESVVQQLQQIGIVSPEVLADYVSLKAQSLSVVELLRDLVTKQHLTKFQATQFVEGKGESLILGSYTLIDKIGEGGMGQVYKAEHRRMKRIVAIKTLPRELMSDSGAIARFQREVEAAAKLNHSNVVTAYDADEANGVHFLVMEYVAGSNLSSLVKQHGPFPVREAVNCLQQAARGLEFAHKKGVVHRDIKPSNLLLDANQTVKILDMGLARVDATEPSNVPEGITETGMVMGTFDYMAPEQWHDSRIADARSDLYALGCTFHYLLVGRAPYADEKHRNPVTKMRGHTQEPIPDLQAARPDVPGELAAIYRKLLEKLPENRYQSAAQLIEALAKVPGTETADGQSMSKTNPRADLIMRESVIQSSNFIASPETTSISADSKEALIDTARRSFDHHDYPDVVMLLESIPQKSRTETINMLLEEATKRQVQFDRLLLRIEDAKRQQNGKALIAAAEKLLAIKPQHGPTRRLLKTLKSYGDKLEMAKFDAGDEPVALNEVGGILHGLGVYYAAAVAVAVVAFGLGTTVVYPYLGRDAVKKDHSFGGDARISKETTGPLKPLGPSNDKAREKVDPPRNEHSLNEPLLKNPLTNELSQEEPSPKETEPKESLPKEIKSAATGMTLVLVPAGEFTMGSSAEDLNRIGQEITGFNPKYATQEQPAHSVSISRPFYIGKFEITRGEFAKFVESENYRTIPERDGQGGFGYDANRQKVRAEGPQFTWENPGWTPYDDHHPVVNVTWYDAKAFCAWLSKKDRRPYRLPTEAEWEYACRAGTKTWHPGGDQASTLVKIANVADQSMRRIPGISTQIPFVNIDDGYPFTAPVGSFAPNEFGLHDVIGNVWEWCEDEFDANAYRTTKGLTVDPYIRCGNGSYVIRGGSWYILSWSGHSAERYGFTPDSRFDNIGFRIVAPVIQRSQETAQPDAIRLLDIDDPDFQKWTTQVTTLPAQQQIESVARKLQQLNPGFDGKVFGYHEVNGLPDTNCAPRIEGNMVTEFGILTDNVTDVSPLRALSGLKRLCLAASSSHRSHFSDLRPLEGLQLKQLNISGSYVTALTPLIGMPLESLNCCFTHVGSLWPLRGSPLTDLRCHAAAFVSDLKPLQGMKLEHLVISRTAVSDLSPLKDVPLKTLDCSLSKVTDLAALRGLPLTKLYFHGTNVTNLKPLLGMELVDLGLAKTKVIDLSPLVGMPLTSLDCGETEVKDLSALNGTKLTKLNCRGTAVSNLSALKGMPLAELRISQSKVSSLVPLKGLKLRELHCGDLPISDLSPLEGMPLTLLTIDETEVTDLSHLRAMGLTEVFLSPTKITTARNVLRNIKTLKSISVGLHGINKNALEQFYYSAAENRTFSTGHPGPQQRYAPDDFWKKYDQFQPITTVHLHSLIPKSFEFDLVNAGTDAKRRFWSRPDDFTFIERYPSGKEDRMRILGRIKIAGVHGTVVENIRNEQLQVFIPDHGNKEMLVQFRNVDPNTVGMAAAFNAGKVSTYVIELPNQWSRLGVMEKIKTGADNSK